MFAPTHRDRSSLGRVVEGLPEDYHVLPLDHGYLVVGPTGAFALTRDEPDVDLAAARIARTASQVREDLASRLSWAPFVDTLVVVDGAAARTEVAAVVPARLLGDVLTAGPQVLAPDQVERIVTVLA